VEAAAVAVQAAVREAAAWAAVDLPAAKAEAEVDAPVVAEEARVVAAADARAAVVVDKVAEAAVVVPAVEVGPAAIASSFIYEGAPSRAPFFCAGEQMQL